MDEEVCGTNSSIVTASGGVGKGMMTRIGLHHNGYWIWGVMDMTTCLNGWGWVGDGLVKWDGWVGILVRAGSICHIISVCNG